MQQLTVHKRLRKDKTVCAEIIIVISLPSSISFSNPRLFSIGISDTFPACNSYSTLTGTCRLVSCVTSSSLCDSDLKYKWYRFVKNAGTSLPEICPPTNRCKANAPGWLNGKHPTVEDGEVTRTVCFNKDGSCCWQTRQVNIYNCSGFYVYKLPPTHRCSLRYCSTYDG